MHWFQKTSLRRKQTLIIMLTSSVVLLLACVAFSVYEGIAFRHTMKQNLATLADIVDHNTTAALDFNDAKSAEETLSALQADPAIIGAWLYTKGGEVFAKYDRPNDNIVFAPPAILPNGTLFQGHRLVLCRPVVLKGETVGTLYLESDMQALHARLTRYAMIAGLVFVVSWLIAFALSSRLQRLVSDPILQLAQLARSVALDKNYSVRAVKRSGDELGQLIDGFNEMLEQIQERDAALLAARDHLEQHVQERTTELAQSLSLLNATLDSTADGILAQNLSGQITLHNTKFAVIWGFPKEALERRITEELAAFVCQQIKDPEKLVQRIKEAQTNPETEVFDVFEFKDGRTFERYSIPQRIGSQCVGVVVSWRDVTERRQTEEALRDSQALYHSLVEQLPIGVFRKDKEGRFVFVNSWFCQFKGATASQFLGKKPHEVAASEVAGLELGNPEERREAKLAIQGASDHEQIMRTGRQIKLEEQNPGAEGKPQYLHVVKSPVFSPDGKIVGSQGILLDITERKLAENELNWKTAFLEAQANSSIDGIIVVDQQGKKILQNQRTADLFKIPQHIADDKDDDQQVRWVTSMTKNPEQFIEKVVHLYSHPNEISRDEIELKDGTVLDRYSSPVIGKTGKYYGRIWAFRDNTERKRTENALRKSEERFRSYFEIGVIGIAITSPTKGCLEVNDQICQILGYERSELLQMSWANFTHPDDLAADVANFNRILAGECNGYSIDKRFIRKDGQVVHATISVKCVRCADGSVDYLLGLLQDITERKLSEAELEKVHKQLLETSRQAGMAEVATSVLHNVGNVLNSVNVSSTCVADNLRKSKAVNLSKVVTLLREHETDLAAFFCGDPRGKQIPGYLAQLASHLAGEQNAALKELAGLQKNIEHIKDIVAMQQSYAKVSGVTETLQISDLVEDALHMNASALARHQVQVLREYAEVPAVTIQKHKVLQVLVNLIRNAKYACDDSGRTDKRLTLRVASGGNRVRISIGDNGVGIPAENLIRIFNHGFTTRKEGHGFGLHSGALAAKELGGSLGVQSDGLGKGAVFTLEIPFEPPSGAKLNAV